MNIVFYQNSAESNLLDKSASLVNALTLEGTLRESSSIVNPVITIENDGVFVWNYAYIEDFQRYYFITNVESVRKNIWKISMKCDVLMSFKTTTLLQSAFIERNQNTYDEFIADNEYPVESSKLINEYEVDATSFSFNPEEAYTSQRMLLNTSAEILDPTVPVSTRVLDPESNVLSSVNFNSLPSIYQNNHYMLTSTGVQQVAKYLAGHTAQASFVVSALLYPFAIMPELPSTYSTIKFGSTDSEIQAYIADVSETTMIKYGNFTITKPNSIEWLNYEPYSYYEVYIPYSGWISVKGNEVLGKVLSLYYILSTEDGSAQYFLTEETTGKLIHGGLCQLGISVSFTTTNSQQIQDQRIQSGISMALSGIGAVAGFATGNPYMVAGSASSIVGTIGSLATQHETAQCGIHSGEIGQFAPQKVRVRKTYAYSNTGLDYSTFRQFHGSPLKQIKTLSSLSGYTEVGKIHLEGYSIATDGELTELESLLKSGVILPTSTEN